MNYPGYRFASRSAGARNALIRATSAIALAVTLPTVAFAAAPANAQSARQVAIAAQPLGTALMALSRQTGISLFATDRLIAGKSSPAISGHMTPEAALTRMLQGTDLTYRRNADGTYLVVPAPRSVAEAPTARVQTVVDSSEAKLAPEPASAGDEEIIVTARKREESILDVPVIMTAIGGEAIRRRGMNNLDTIAQFVPQLVIGGGAGPQGGTIALRGISGPTGSPQGDSAVAFNIDGVQLAKGSVRRIGMFDIERVEVLKGPQALFYGKNSPGGIITIRTADPTPQLKGSISAGYEFEAHEVRTEGFISGPISDTLGFRLAGFYSKSRGYLKEVTPDGAFLAPDRNWVPRGKNFGIRGTLKFAPTDDLLVKAKLTHGQFQGSGLASTYQVINCPTGALQGFGGGGDTCRADGKTVNTSVGRTLRSVDNTYPADGNVYDKQKQTMGSLEVSHDFTDEINLTSVTGYYKADYKSSTNFLPTHTAALTSANRLNQEEIMEELRISTEYDGPLNFTGGVFYGSSKLSVRTHVGLIAAEEPSAGVGIFRTLITNGLFRVPVQLNNFLAQTRGNTYSAFLQLRYNPIDVVEISIGGRYSHERKRILPVITSGNRVAAAIAGGAPLVALNPSDPSQIRTPGVSKRSWNDFSPEATISWKPQENLNLFASYKHGFLSGGFNTGNVAFVNGFNSGYDQQIVKGFEAGIKAELLDNTLQANLAAYSYKISGQQVTNFTNAQSRLENAAGSKVEGFEFDFNYQTPLRGLSLRGAAAYNKGRFTSFLTAPCYGGQTAAEGCNVAVGNQDLSGTPLVNAPEWNLSGGVDYEASLGDSLVLGLSAGVNYTSGQVTSLNANPDAYMPSYTLLSGGVRIGDAAKRWELAVIGKNLTNEYYWTTANDLTFSGGALGSGIHPDIAANISRGREVMVRATYNF